MGRNRTYPKGFGEDLKSYCAHRKELEYKEFERAFNAYTAFVGDVSDETEIGVRNHMLSNPDLRIVFAIFRAFPYMNIRGRLEKEAGKYVLEHLPDRGIEKYADTVVSELTAGLSAEMDRIFSDRRLHEYVSTALEVLNRDERQIIEERYMGDKARRIEEVSIRVMTEIERVRNIERYALNKLRHSPGRDMIEMYFLGMKWV